MTQVTSQALQRVCRRRHGRDVVVRSRHEQRRPEKLGRRLSTAVYDGRSGSSESPSQYCYRHHATVLLLLLLLLLLVLLLLKLKQAVTARHYRVNDKPKAY